jgi:hypothetical protein
MGLILTQNEMAEIVLQRHIYVKTAAEITDYSIHISDVSLDQVGWEA